MQDKQREGQGTHCMVVALAKRLFLEPSLISQRKFLWSRRCSEAAFLAHLPGLLLLMLPNGLDWLSYLAGEGRGKAGKAKKKAAQGPSSHEVLSLVICKGLHNGLFYRKKS